MAIRDLDRCLDVDPSVRSITDLADGINTTHSPLSWYLSLNGTEACEVGSVLLVPTYRLEEVEEIVEPEKPAKLATPVVGLSWEIDGRKIVIVEVGPNFLRYAAQGRKGSDEWCLVYYPIHHWRSSLWNLVNYPRTLSIPAVTRRVKKWVKIEQPSVDSDG